MARTGIVTDSTSNLPEGLRERYGISIVPLFVNWGDASYRDGVDLSTQDFYQRLRTDKMSPRTGAPSLHAFEEAYRAQLEQHEFVVEVSLAGKLSATVDVARQAAESVDPDRIRVVDTGSVSIGTGWLVAQAGEMAAAGATPDEIVPVLNEMAPRLKILVVLDTLEFLKRGGRIGRAQALAGTLLNVKPILTIEDGEVHPLERVRTTSAALRRLVELVPRQGRIERLGVMHGDALASADEVARQLQSMFPDLTVDRGELGPVVGTHGGPGTVGVALLLGR